MQSFTFIVLSLAFSLSNGAQVEQDLLETLLYKYDTRIRPVADPNDAVTVSVDIYLQKMRNINEFSGNCDLGLWLGMTWNDSRLAWQPSDNKNTKKMIIPSKQIWTPDFFLYTGYGVFEASIRSDEKYGATVKSTGQVYYLHPLNEPIPCVHKTEKDGLVCTFSLQSWSMPSDMLHLLTSKPVIDTSLLGTYIDPTYKVKITSLDVRKYAFPEFPDDKFEMINARIVLDTNKKNF